MSSVSLSTASLAAQQTASGLKEAATGLKESLSKGKRLLQQALATGDAQEEQVWPNRALGGVLGIQLCGVLMPRLPSPEEDADPLLQVRGLARPIAWGLHLLDVYVKTFV